jgi:hypothetical protein
VSKSTRHNKSSKRMRSRKANKAKRWNYDVSKSKQDLFSSAPVKQFEWVDTVEDEEQ